MFSQSGATAASTTGVCPNAATSSCATNTSSHTLQCFPAVLPAFKQSAAIAASTTSVCPKAATSSCATNTSSHTLHFLPSVKPVFTQSGATAANTSSVCPKAASPVRVVVSPHEHVPNSTSASVQVAAL